MVPDHHRYDLFDDAAVFRFEPLQTFDSPNDYPYFNGTTEPMTSESHAASSKLHESVARLDNGSLGFMPEIRNIIGRVSFFMRHTFPERLCSPMASQGTPWITRELIQDFQYLRILKFHMTEEQYLKAECFIQTALEWINKLIDTIKSEAKATTPDMRRVNETLEHAVQRVDDEGRAFCALLDSQ